MNKFLNILKIIGLIILIALSGLGIILSIILIPKKYRDKTDKIYLNKLQKALQEKLNADEKVSNSNYDDYNDNGTSKPRKAK